MTLSATQRATRALQRFARGPERTHEASAAHVAPERCELCAAPVASAHAHVLEAHSRTVRCACAACAILFDDDQPQARYRRLSGRATSLPVAISDADLAALGVPVRLFFLCPSRAHDALFMIYPSAAGPIEAQSSWHGWRELVARHAELAAVEPDRDALLVDLRAGSARAPLQLSLDLAYELLGHLRTSEGATGFWRFEQRLDALYQQGGARG